MSLHKHLLRLNLNDYSPTKNNTLHIEDVIKNSIFHQIKHHQNQYHCTPEHKLIMSTKKILGKSVTRQQMNKTVFANFISESYGQKRRGVSTSFNTRKEKKLGVAKKQLQLFNQIQKNVNRQKIKRYQEQIQQEEKQIQRTIAQQKIKRNWLTPTPNRGKSRIRRELIQSSTFGKDNIEEQDKTYKISSTIEEGQLYFQKLLNPYRRIFLERRKSKGKVQPWQVTVSQF